MEQKNKYVYLSMFNDVNVCKCLMSHMQIEANVHGVHTCLHALVCINSSAGASRSCVIFWNNLQNATCFPRKDIDNLRYIYYVQTIAPENDLPMARWIVV